MPIVQTSSSSGVAAKGAGTARAVDDASAAINGGTGTRAEGAAPRSAPASLKRGLSNWDHQLQGEISNAQQTLDYLERSSSQLQALKSELAAKLAARQGREGQVEARVRQFSNTWRQRASASGGTLDAQLSYTSPQAAQQNFTIRGLTMASLQEGPQEVLAFSVGGANQSLRSVNIEPGLSEDQIIARFDQALMPSGIRVKQGDNGEVVFSTPEASWANVRDSLSVRGSGIRYPIGQMSRVRTGCGTGRHYTGRVEYRRRGSAAGHLAASGAGAGAIAGGTQLRQPGAGPGHGTCGQGPAGAGQRQHGHPGGKFHGKGQQARL